ncbi:cyclic-guanylate-specific phosphodiesterase [Bordetella sputigena]|uniref:EAL domain-containing protein n=1 Tax=Bordetella sputigena TaxID=1416810 RepID=UPI0039F0CD33
MPTSLSIRRRIAAIVVTLVAAALPFLLILPIILLESQRQLAGEASVTAGVLRRQLENILLRAQDVTHRLTSTLRRPCGEVLPLLRQMGSLQPYFRSLLLVHDDVVTCSSVYGMPNTPLIALSPQEHVPQGMLVTPVAGTLLVPDRPAVMVSRGLRDGNGVVAFLDAQYLYDLKLAAARDGVYDVDILLGPRNVPLLDAGERQRGARMPGPDTQQSSSSMFPVQVRVTPMQAQRDAVRGQVWRGYAAFLLLASLLCGYGAYRLYDWRVSIPGEIRKGMRARQFHLVYQPVFDMSTGRMSGVEALLRWRHPRLGNVRPDLFIAAAEEHHIIDDLTRHMFELAAGDLALLKLPPGSHLAVNVCGAHIVSDRFVADVDGLLARLRAYDDVRLVLEVTERHPLPDTPALRGNMAELRERGVRWALDDFGTGHSSLSYLQRLHVHFLKIDRAFVSSAGTEAVGNVVLDTVIGLARQLGLLMIAEGVETEAQAAYLSDKGVQFAQGFLFARPMPPRELAAWRSEQADAVAARMPGRMALADTA